VLVLVLGLVPELALGATIYDSGPMTFTPAGTQFGRISRTGRPSDWSGPKPFPGVSGAPAARAYEVITVNSGPFPYLQILIDDPTASLFDAAYRNSFTPVNIAPTYGLNVNYLGDPGLTQPFGNPSFFQIVVAPFTNVLIVINEITPGNGLNKPFRLMVEGFYATNYKDSVPSASARSSPLLFVSGAVAPGVERRKPREASGRDIYTRRSLFQRRRSHEVA
jgi:hypothetical protein